MMTAAPREKTQSAELNFELYFVTEVLKLSSLHYGYWEKGTASGTLDLDEIRAAQALFTEKLLSYIPEETKTILDVGAGIGDNARALAKAGYHVTSISPDRNHQRYFDENPDPNITFHRSKFEDFDSDHQFDLILLCESHRYFERHAGLSQCRRLVRPGGHLLVCGMFRNANNKKFPKDFDLSQLEYITTAADYGFAPEKIVDITRRVAPTMKIMSRTIEQYVDPSVELAQKYLEARAPIKARILKFVFSSQLGYLDEMISKYRKRTNTRRFKKWYRYATVLLKDTELG